MPIVLFIVSGTILTLLLDGVAPYYFPILSMTRGCCGAVVLLLMLLVFIGIHGRDSRKSKSNHNNERR